MRSPQLVAALTALALASASSQASAQCDSTPRVENHDLRGFQHPLLAALGIPDALGAGAFRFQVDNAPKSAAGVLVLDHPSAPAWSSLFETELYVTSAGKGYPFTTDGSGKASFVPVPFQAPHPELCGVELVAQAFVADATAPGGQRWTSAVSFHFGDPLELLYGLTRDNFGLAHVAAIDPDTGHAWIAGQIGNGSQIVTDLAFDPAGGALLVSTFSLGPTGISLLEVDPQTFGTLAQKSIPPGNLDSLAYDAAGTLYASAQRGSGRFLVTVDPQTLATHPVGDLENRLIVSLAFDPTLGTLWALEQLPQPFTAPLLHRLDPQSGAILGSVQLDEPLIGAFTIAPDGRFLASSKFSELRQIDPLSGATTLIGAGRTQQFVYGLAFPPGAR